MIHTHQLLLVHQDVPPSFDESEQQELAALLAWSAAPFGNCFLDDRAGHAARLPRTGELFPNPIGCGREKMRGENTTP